MQKKILTVAFLLILGIFNNDLRAQELVKKLEITIIPFYTMGPRALHISEMNQILFPKNHNN